MPAPIVLISPAMAVPSRFYRPLAAAFEEQGWSARALGRRGFEPDGLVASRANDWSYADEIADLAEAVTAARAEDSSRPVIILGHSLGAQLAIGHESSHSPADGLILIGASVPHYRYYPYAGLPILTMGTAVTAVTALAGYLPKPAFGAPGARTLMNEWAAFVRTGRPPFEYDGRVSTPSFVVHLQGDTYAVSPANKRFIEQFIDPEAVTRWVYTHDAAPEGATTDHVLWARRPEIVVQHIVDWWREQTS